MAKEKPQYEIVKEFSVMAKQVVDKYPELFHGVEVDQIRCKKIINKDRPETKKDKWQIKSIPPIMEEDCPYGWYIEVFSSDCDAMGEKYKYALIL